ncbi:hypothetical protein CQ12_32245 [Bradyrhizobium jicamae]|uniref:Uncharacterized protein n=1 Tax=Bradyrhizobium jicamae TaxID=280332 RepID=A0A0R3M3N5_9BRAD|nr:hypothetical protein [Bradyrhizobium jicamae]KRR14914.1 hypothetical protein CQ12_32245 [Bradyrhizobium jicamae]
MPIEINLEGLRPEIIGQIKKVRIFGGEPIVVNPKNNRITVEVPTDVGDGPFFIAFMDEEGKTLAELIYDQKAKEFPQLVPDPKPAAPPTNPQADLELTLKIGTKSALNAFLKRHPEGFYADLAKAQLEKIEAEEAAAKKR